MTQLQDLVIESPDQSVRTIRLNRPDVKNAIRNNLLYELAMLLDEYKEEESIRCVVITGNEKQFAAGADIKEIAKLDSVGVLQNVRYEYWQKIKQFPKPVIAAVNGYALGGGCELAMHADVIIAGSNAQFGLPEINLGMIPGAGGTQRLIRSVGKSLAMKMILSGEFINAQQALASGLVAEITEPELTQTKAEKLAQLIAQKPPLAVQQAKKLMSLSFESTLETGLAAEHQAFTVLAGTKDRNEGINAFLEKRTPTFTGK